MTLQTLLNDEQKAFEELLHPSVGFCDCLYLPEARTNLHKMTCRLYGNTLSRNLNDYDERIIKSFIALHDQKIITAVIGMLPKEYDESNVTPFATLAEMKQWNRCLREIKSPLQQALKKEMV